MWHSMNNPKQTHKQPSMQIMTELLKGFALAGGAGARWSFFGSGWEKGAGWLAIRWPAQKPLIINLRIKRKFFGSGLGGCWH